MNQREEEEYRLLVDYMAEIREVFLDIAPEYGGNPLYEMVGSPQAVAYYVLEWLRHLQKEYQDNYDPDRQI